MPVTTFVLVHGAMHGGWCWREVARELRRDGFEAFTPTLTGQGERRHLRTGATGVATHVEDVGSVLEFEDLTGVVLVLHSYAGVLAGPIAERCRDRLAAIVYLGAFLAAPGESLLDVEPAEVAERYRALAAGSPTGDVVPASEAFLDQWGLHDPLTRAWVGPRLTDFPLRCATDPVEYDASALVALRQVYVRHTTPPLPSLDASYARASDAGWEIHDMECGHDLMVEAPAATAALLEQLATVVP